MDYRLYPAVLDAYDRIGYVGKKTVMRDHDHGSLLFAAHVLKQL